MSRDDLMREESEALVLWLFSPREAFRTLEFGGDVRRTEGAGVGFDFVFCLRIISLLYHVVARSER